MSRRNVNYLLYNNARAWMDGLDIKRDVEDDKKMNEEDFMNKMIYDQFVVINGMQPNGRPLIIIVVSEMNSFSKKKDTERVIAKIPDDGSVDGVVISIKLANQLAPYAHIKNVKHDWMLIDPRTHINSAKYTIVSDEKEIEEVLYDAVLKTRADLTALPKEKLVSNPLLFWIGAKKGDVLKITYDAEDVSVGGEYHLVV
jgi:DNA-directed RNA polymerase subunit H (RpoH/RPB5)